MTILETIPKGLSRQVRPQPSTKRAGRSLSHVHILPTFALCMIVCAWFVTWGDWRLFDAERFGGYYDAQARAILHGRLDVPPAAIGFEAFIRDGKTYGYFGIAPALLRLPVLLLFPNMDGHWSRLYVLMACSLNVIYAHRLLLLATAEKSTNSPKSVTQSNSISRKLIHHLFILSTGIGSTTVFLASRSYTYHEAILWGATFAIMFAYYLLRFSLTPRPHLLAIAGVCCFLSFLSRGTAGAGALLAIVVLFVCLIVKGRDWLEKPERTPIGEAAGPASSGRVGVPAHHESPHRTSNGGRVHPPYKSQIPTSNVQWRNSVLIAFTTIAITISTHLGINYAKFRTFDSVPVRYYGLYLKDPDRMKATGGKQIHLANLPTNLAAYFGLGGVVAGPQFPWLYMTTQPRIYPGAVIDVIEPHSSIPMTMPSLFLLALLGLKGKMSVGSDNREIKGILPLLAVSLLIGGSVVLVTVGITERYLHDFYPFLIVAGAAGAGRLMTRRRPGFNAALLAPLVLVSVILNCAFAFDFQREIVWGVPHAKRAELTDIRNSINHYLNRPPVADDREQP